jgi:hypothetical protein
MTERWILAGAPFSSVRAMIRKLASSFGSGAFFFAAVGLSRPPRAFCAPVGRPAALGGIARSFFRSLRAGPLVVHMHYSPRPPIGIFAVGHA